MTAIASYVKRPEAQGDGFGSSQVERLQGTMEWTIANAASCPSASQLRLLHGPLVHDLDRVSTAAESVACGLLPRCAARA